jgi:hypothetical protein
MATREPGAKGACKAGDRVVNVYLTRVTISLVRSCF